MDDYCLVVDTKRATIINSGPTVGGFSKVWIKHMNDSILEEYYQRKTKMHSSYPNIECKDIAFCTGDKVKGSFQHLSSKIGILMKRSESDSIVSMFE